MGEMLEDLKGMNKSRLRAAYRKYIGTDAPPAASANLLRWWISWHVQAGEIGGLSTETRKRLRALERSYARNPDYLPCTDEGPGVGTVLVREWNGTRHQVTVTKEGYRWNDVTYGSLSEVARAITGTRWSGPRFFGLKSNGEPVND